MAALYEAPKTHEDDEHVYTEPRPVIGSGNSEPQPSTSIGNKGDNSNKAIRVVVLVLGIISVFILTLVGISAYLLQSTEPHVFCQKGQSGEDCQTIDAELARLHHEVISLTTEVKRLTTEETRLTKEVATLKSALANTMTNRTTSHTARAVGFYAYNPEPSSPASHMRFGVVRTNEGNAYNASTGVFTCPVAGTYYLSAVLRKDFNFKGRAYCDIKINDAQLAKAFVYPGNANATGDYTAVGVTYIRLTVGDIVSLEDCTTPINDAFNWYSSFSGFLVTPDE